MPQSRPQPSNPFHNLDRVCTVLYQQQNATEAKLHNSLKSIINNTTTIDPASLITHEFFLQVCNKFPYSWKPVHNFFQFTESLQLVEHTSVSYNKMIDVYAKSKNIDLLWNCVHQMASRRLVNDKTFRVAIKGLASARELKKCVELFHLAKSHGVEYSVLILNKVLDTLCHAKLVDEAKFIVFKLGDFIQPDVHTFRSLIEGFCNAGDIIEACKLWNLMVDRGLGIDICSVEKLMETMLKKNQFSDAFKLFQAIRSKSNSNLGLSTYRLLIHWLCKKGSIGEARHLYDEMCSRGIVADNATLSSLIYGLLVKSRVREAYIIVEGIENPEISVYHGLIKGLLRLKKPSEATQVFREMIRRGCEPTMHTYIMLLQGHMGKRGRKGDDPLVNFDTIFVGGLVNAGKSLEATKYVERVLDRGREVPRFDYNKFLHYYSNDEGVSMFEDMAKKLREIGLFDLADIFARYGQKMTTREKRRDRAREHNQGIKS
uniref:Pentatricopeptide repeat-containing protein n=1 Tax=Kalanchoe fedtschenkoi TaxID=63787 RepID=A0A7N0SVZ0_KALFE